MKKLLLSLALVATGAGFASAQTTVEFLSSNKQLEYTGTTSGNNIQPLQTLSNGGVTITFTKDNGSVKGSTNPAWYGFAEGQTYNSFRCYANNTMTLAAPSGQQIKSIEITFADNFGKDAYANLIADSGTITPQVDKTNNPPTNGMTITWTGDAASVKLAVPNDKSLTVGNKSPQCQMIKIIVTLGTGGGPVAPAAPVISGTETFYGATNTVSITAAAGATIYYTMQYNGTPADPTTSSLEYEEEIVINNTATIKAIAVKDGLTSAVASKTFTKGTATEVASIADFLTKEKGTVCVFKNPVTVMGLYNKRYLFVKDASGALQIFDGSGKLDRPYQMGQTISGFTVKADVYNNNPQGAAADFISTFPATGAGTAREIKPLAIAATEDAVKANLNNYVVLTGTITKTDNNYYIDAVQLYDRFSLKTITETNVGQTKDVAGYAVIFNKTPELYYTQLGEPNTLSVGGIEESTAPIYGAEGYVVAPEGAQIYSISGVRVANNGLAAGVYLVRFNGNTTKVVVK